MTIWPSRWRRRSGLWQELETTERRTLKEILAPYREKHPDVQVSMRLVAGGAGKAMVGASQGA
jgi:hypothetical protein